MNNKKGFTLVELLATIAILGLLAAIAGISISGVMSNSKSKITTIQKNMYIEAAKAFVAENASKFKKDGQICYKNNAFCLNTTKSNGVYTTKIKANQLAQLGYIETSEIDYSLTVTYDANNSKFEYDLK